MTSRLIFFLAIADPANGQVADILLRTEALLLSIAQLGHLTDLMFDRAGCHLFLSHGDRGAISVLDATNGNLLRVIDLATGSDAIVELVRMPGGKAELALHGKSDLIRALNLEDQVEVRSTNVVRSRLSRLAKRQ